MRKQETCDICDRRSINKIEKSTANAMVQSAAGSFGIELLEQRRLMSAVPSVATHSHLAHLAHQSHVAHLNHVRHLAHLAHVAKLPQESETSSESDTAVDTDNIQSGDQSGDSQSNSAD